MAPPGVAALTAWLMVAAGTGTAIAGIGIFWTRATDAQVIAETILGIANMAINSRRY
jgi:hypothetical protein